MNLDIFRRELLARHREASRCARARAIGDPCDESRLDEQDLDLLSPAATAQAIEEFLGAPPGSAARASSRSRLAIVLEEGILARLRPLDRAIESSLGRGRFEEARELADERRRSLAQEGARTFAHVPRPLPTGTAGGASDGANEPAPRPQEKQEAVTRARELGALVRGETADDLAQQASVLLTASVPIADRLADQRGRETVTGPDPGEIRSAARAASGLLTMDECVEAVLLQWRGPAPAIAYGAIVPALRELGRDLDVDPRARIEIVPTSSARVRLADAQGVKIASATACPCVLEEDPPETVTVLLPQRDGQDAFGGALAAWGAAVSASVRSAALGEEHRLRADPALGGAVGVLAASLTPEHAALHRVTGSSGLRALAREVASARIAAARALDADRLLSGSGSARGDGEGDAMDEASLGCLHGPAFASPREPPFTAPDAFRAHLLAPGLRERLRTRFGNLWYRERAAGRLLREACEPGGSLLIAEIFAGLSIPKEGAESVVDSWHDEIKRLR